MEKRAFEQTGLVPRSIIRTFDRFRRQLLKGAEASVIQEFRVSRYQVLVSVKCLLSLLIIPLVVNFLAKTFFLMPLTEYLWNTQQNEIFLNLYQENRAFSELHDFEEKLFFESLIETQPVTEKPDPTSIFETEKLYKAEVKNNTKILHKSLLTSKIPEGDISSDNESVISLQTVRDPNFISKFKVDLPQKSKNLSTENNLHGSPLRSDILKGNHANLIFQPKKVSLTKSENCVNNKKSLPKDYSSMKCIEKTNTIKEKSNSTKDTFFLENKRLDKNLVFVKNGSSGVEALKQDQLTYSLPFNMVPLRGTILPQRGTMGPQSAPIIAQGATMIEENPCEAKLLYSTPFTGVQGGGKLNSKQSFYLENSLPQKFQQKTIELAIYYNQQSIEAITNLFGDFITFITISFLFIWMEPQIIILKSFLTESIYSLSDTTKSFLLILLTDLLVGFHSPRGWEIFIELILRHFGLPENQDFIFLFVATFPVLLDTVFKYWIFRYLNQISPSTVATYHSMIE